jgi:hypothetical protein
MLRNWWRKVTRRETSSGRPEGRPGRKRRYRAPLGIERLEDRTLLDGTPLTAPQQQALLDGLQGLATWAGRMGNFDVLGQRVTVVGQTVGQAVQLDQLFNTRLYQPVRQYLSTPEPTVEGLVGALNALPEAGHNVVAQTVGSELQFQGIVFCAATSSTRPIDLGSHAADLGISLPAAPSVAVTGTAHLDFALGVDLNTNQFAAHFSNSDPARLAGSVHATGLNFGVHFSAPAADLQVLGGTLDLQASAGVTFRDPHGNGALTLADLQGAPLASLVALAGSGSASASLPLNATLPGFAVLGPATIAVHAGRVFNLPTPDVTLSVALSPDLRGPVGSVLAALGHVGDMGYYYRYVGVKDTQLPAIGKSVDQVLYGPGEAHAEDFLNLGPAAAAYFQGTGSPTADGLGQALLDRGLSLAGSSATGSLAFGPLSVTGGLDPVHRQLRFDVTVAASRSRQVPVTINLGSDAHLLYGLVASATASATATVGFDLNLRCSVGLDLDGYLSNPGQGFQSRDLFLQVPTFIVGGHVRATDLNFDLTVGLLQAGVANGAVGQLDPTLAVLFHNPDGSQKVTLQDLQGGELEFIRRTSLTPTAGVDVTLPVYGRLNGYDFATAGPRVNLHTGDLFTIPPTVQLVNFDRLLPFSNMDPHTFLATLGHLGTWLGQFRGSAALSTTPIPFTRGRTIGDVFKLDEAFTQELLNRLTGSDGGHDVPTFMTAQELASQLAERLGLDPQFVNAQYYPATNELTYHVRFTRNFDRANIPLGFSVQGLPLVIADGSATLNVDANATLEFTFGVDLTPRQPPSIASTADAGFALPADGRLTADAHFTLTVGNLTQDVTVSRSATANDHNLNDLVRVINAALQQTPLGPVVTATLNAGTQGNRIVLSVPSLAAGTVIRMRIGSAQDPAVTQLGFADGLLARAGIADLFIQDASVTGSATLSVSDIHTAARFALLGLQIGHGSASGTGNLVVLLKDPVHGQVGGRVSLTDLFANLTSVTRIANWSVSGSARLDLTNISVDAGFVSTTGTPSVSINVPDFSNLNTASAGYTDFGNLLPFGRLAFNDILNVLRQAVDAIRSYTSFPTEVRQLLTQKLPGIDASITDLIDYAGRFVGVIDDLQRNPSTTVQLLDARLRQALALAPGSPLVQVSMDERNSLKVDVTFTAPLVRVARSLNLDIATLAALAPGGIPAGLRDVARLTHTSGSGQLQVDVRATVHLVLGLELNAYADPLPFLYDSSGASLEALVNGSNLNFQAAVGPLGLFIRNGSALLDLDGSGRSGAQFAVSLLPPADGSHRYYFSDGLARIFGNIHGSLTGKARLSFPIYFPRENDPLGGANNRLTFTLDNLGDVLRGRLGSVAVSTPDIATALHNLTALLDLFRNPAVFLNGLDTALGFLQGALNNRVFGVNLPLIGSHLRDAAQFIQNFRDRVISRVRTVVSDLNGDLLGRIQQVLTDIFGFGTGGLGLLVGSVNLQPAYPSTYAQFNLHLHQDLMDATLPINFDIGLPALGLSVNGGVRLRLGWDFYFGFGVSLADGFYIDTTPVSGGHHFTVSVDVSAPNLVANGRLVFLNLTATDRGSHFGPTFTVDLSTPNNRLTFRDIAAGPDLGRLVTAHFDATAHVDLGLEASFGGDARFPRLLAEFLLDWRVHDFTSDPPTVQFRDVRLDLGSFISRFAGPILRDIETVLGPVKEVVDALRTRLPVISDLRGRTYTFLDLVHDLGGGDYTGFLNAFDFFYNLVHSIPATSGELVINFGSFDLGNLDVRGLPDLTGAAPHVTQTQPSVDQQLVNQGAPADVRTFTARLSSPTFDFDFPVLGVSGPDLVFRLLLGQAVDLFTFDLTALQVHFSYSQEFPIFGPIVATLSGSLDAAIHFRCGYDTTGLREFVSSHNTLDLLDGFYIYAGTNNSDPQGTYATVHGGIGAGVGIDLILVAGGVEGGIDATVRLGLHRPNGDPKLRFRYLAYGLAHDPFSLFELSGELSGRLYAWYRILFSRHEFTIARITLLSFDLNRTAAYEPVLATDRGDGVLQLNVGPHADERLFGNLADHDESFQVRHVSGDAGDETVEVTYFSPDGPVTQQYSHVRKIVAQAGDGAEVIDLSGVLADCELHAGPGQDTLYASDGNAVLYGGPDDDTLYGGAGATVFIGGPGHHRLIAGSGTATVQETADTNFFLSDDLLDMPGYGQDELVGVGQAVLTAGPHDTIFTVSGWTGTATLIGQEGFLNTVESANDADFTLTDTLLSVSTGATFTLVNIQRAILTGGPGANAFIVSDWSGLALLDGGGGNDVYFVTFRGQGAGTTVIAATAPGGTASVFVNGSPADEFVWTDTQVRLWNESVTFEGIDQLTVNGQVIFGGPGSDNDPGHAGTASMARGGPSAARPLTVADRQTPHSTPLHPTPAPGLPITLPGTDTPTSPITESVAGGNDRSPADDPGDPVALQSTIIPGRIMAFPRDPSPGAGAALASAASDRAGGQNLPQPGARERQPATAETRAGRLVLSDARPVPPVGIPALPLFSLSPSDPPAPAAIPLPAGGAASPPNRAPLDWLFASLAEEHRRPNLSRRKPDADKPAADGWPDGLPRTFPV